MTGPITNFELGKTQHDQYEAEASQYWKQDARRSPSNKQKLTLAVSGTGLIALLVLLMLVL